MGPIWDPGDLAASRHAEDSSGTVRDPGNVEATADVIGRGPENDELEDEFAEMQDLVVSDDEDDPHGLGKASGSRGVTNISNRVLLLFWICPSTQPMDGSRLLAKNMCKSARIPAVFLDCIRYCGTDSNHMRK